MESNRGTSARPGSGLARGPQLDSDVEVQRARGSLQRRERRADTTGFETGDRGLTADSPDRLQGVPVDHLVECRHGNLG
jgi:hypothetical protein